MGEKKNTWYDRVSVTSSHLDGCERSYHSSQVTKKANKDGRYSNYMKANLVVISSC